MPDTVAISRKCAKYFAEHDIFHPADKQYQRFKAELEAALRSDDEWVKVSNQEIPDDLPTGSEVLWQTPWYLDTDDIWRPRPRTPIAYRRSSKEGK